MVSVAELLNPEPPRAPLPTSRPVPLSPAHQTAPDRNEPSPARPPIEAPRMAENSRNPPRYKAKAPICYPPFENLDDASLREVRRFQVHPFGSIRETCERIPYNSGKKDFFSKTGREGFEAFHYDFKVPGDDTTYTVMWDYSVGLVRMTSFFKCRGYSKTTPAKMLNLNPGLKDITYSITGGSIKAQGYWMPYSCARAICATFCHKIAGALIPLFGPQFPHECIPEKAPGHGRMIISPEIVARAKSEAAALFRAPASLPSPRSSRSASPLPSQRSARLAEPYDYHSDYDRRLLLSPYTDTDVDYHPAPEHYSRRAYPPMPPLRIPTSRPQIPPAAAPTPLHSPGWKAVNHPQPPTGAYHHRSVSHLNDELHGLNVSATANPWLSAIPRSPTPGNGGGRPGAGRWPHAYPPPRSHHPLSTALPERGITLPPIRLKRQFDQINDAGDNNPRNRTFAAAGAGSDTDDRAYDAGESRAGSASPRSVTAPPPTPTSTSHGQGQAAVGREEGSKPRTPSPRPSSSPSPLNQAAVVALRDRTTTTTTSGEGVGRRASERDAAIMLMHMRGRSEDGSSSSSSRASSDDGMENNANRGRSPARSEIVVVEGDGDSARDGGDAEVLGTPSRSRSPAMLSKEVVSDVSDGPVTRAKRRRTFER